MENPVAREAIAGKRREAMNPNALPVSWSRFNTHFLRYDAPQITLDTSLIAFPDGFEADMKTRVAGAFAAMSALEGGAVANPDEQRMVGHYWLRDADLAPTAEIREQIVRDIAASSAFAKAVHDGVVTPQSGGKFTDVLVIGIGGSALGPQLVADALGSENDRLRVHFFDNTDPDGMERTLARLGSGLQSTLTVVISKSGGTPETRNGMLVAKAAYEAQGLAFGRHAVAVTGAGSHLDKFAVEQGFVQRFPMQDWVGGRTSIMHTVGLVPMTLQGVDVEAFLKGARAMDRQTRMPDAVQNMAMRLALCWHAAGEGRGAKDMVVLPYKDRLVLFSKYLQQLVMESLGKETDLTGNLVHQGIAVYGNKGSTDQHAYVQQLRDGVNNFFATFLEVSLASASVPQVNVDAGVTSGDYLQGFLRGTRRALAENGRQSLTLSIPDLNAEALGALIALFERAVGFYASLVGINAYHQPGVEAGKKAAAQFLTVLAGAKKALATTPRTAVEIAGDSGVEDVYHALNHLAANDPTVHVQRGATPADDRFFL